MHLNVYRSCSWKEKRDVLNVFWRTNVVASARIVEAAVQYGYYTVICLVAIILELALILAVAVARGSFVLWLTIAAELFMFWSTWWAVKRYLVMRSLYRAQT